MTEIYIIAEAGVNHNGEIDRALLLVDAAVATGADAVKFQTFRAEALVISNAEKAGYQLEHTPSSESQLEMLKKLELDEAAHQKIFNHCRTRKIQFLSTPFDIESLLILTDRLDLPRLKISSGDITNSLLLLRAAQSMKPVILSTGISTLKEIETALGILAFGFLPAKGSPSQEAFQNAFHSKAGQKLLAEKVTLLHCTTEYPTPFEEVNLRAMETLRSTFRLTVGLSDHTEGITVAIAAAASGAEVIEKHLTLDKTLPGPDHKASLEPDEFKKMVEGIRQVERAMGSAEKAPTPSEKNNRDIVRKSLVAARKISKGEHFTEHNLTVKRPGKGISSFYYWDYLGKSAKKNYQEDDLIEP